jgi:hypothetical protein
LQSRDTCSKLDFDLYDVHYKKLNTLGKVTLPIQYGKSMLMQEFIITDGISEECILGWDAIRKHGFTIDGETNSIYLAKETLGQAHFRAPHISIILHKRHVICRRTAVVVEARTNGSFPYVSPLATFMFTPSEKLPDNNIFKDKYQTMENIKLLSRISLIKIYVYRGLLN